MKIIFKVIVYLLAMIGALAIALSAYFYFTDPLGLRNIMQTSSAEVPVSEGTPSAVNQYNLSPTQKFFLEKAGIDPAKLPTTISPELEDCLTNAVGEVRASEIKAGAVPTPTDLIKAKSCL